MKIEHLIVQYFYTNKFMSLQEIGSFKLADGLSIPFEGDKDTVLPENAIEFTADAKTQFDEGLIAFIMKNTGKIKPLATSDLESYVTLSKQFINIGKPLVIDSLGVLQKIGNGQLTFTQAGATHVAATEAPKQVVEKVKENIDFAAKKAETKNKITWIVPLLISAIVLGAGLSAYFFIFKNKSASTANTEIAATENNTTEQNTTNTADTSTVKKDSLVKPVITNTADTNSFYIVIKEFTDYATAKKRVDKLASFGNNVMVSTKDSAIYKMRMPFKLPITDTARVRDSLNRFFGAKTYIELP
jgi:flagellar basal body-associated protein FliL